MALLCSTTCGSVALPAALNECDLDILKTSGDRFVFIKCDYQFADVSDPVEWAALKTAGDVVCSPRGFWGKGIPTQNSVDVACGLKVTTQDGQEIEFESSLIDPANDADQDFWKTIRAGYLSYFVIPVTCDGYFLIADGYVDSDLVVGGHPGHEFSWIAPPDFEIVAGENNLLKWVGTMFIPNDGILCRRKLPGVLAAICE